MGDLSCRFILRYFMALVFVAALAGGFALSFTPDARAAGGSFGGGDGSSANPYRIEDVLDLQAMSGSLTAHYELADDIDATATSSWNGGDGFEPIGRDISNSFLGSFNGNGYTINGLYINRPGSPNVGLFGHVGNSSATTEIRNVRLTNTTVYGARGTGTLIGRITGNANTLVEKCSSLAGSVTGNGATGGLIGSHNSWKETSGGTDNPIARYCFADVDVTFSGSGKGDKFGGLAGCSQKGTLDRCFARGSVTHQCTGTINESIGGLAGCIYYRGEINHSYSTGEVSISGDCIRYGGLVGNVNEHPTGGSLGNDGVVISSFWDVDTSGQPTSPGGTGTSTAAMKTESTFTDAGWDFTSTWAIDAGENNGYPYLLNFPPLPPIPELTTIVLALMGIAALAVVYIYRRGKRQRDVTLQSGSRPA